MNQNEEEYQPDGDLTDKKRKELIKERIQKKYLDIGYYESEKRGFFYYGVKSAIGNDFIITNDRKMYLNDFKIIKIKDPATQKNKTITTGQNEIKYFFDYDSDLGEIAPFLSINAINSFFNNVDREHLSKEKIFSEVLKAINYYMDFEDNQNMAYTQACWIIATHCYPLFDWFPHVLFNAPKGSGKTKNAYLMMSLSFRGYDLGISGGVSPAGMFRTIEGNRGTIMLDEFEYLKGSESQQLVNQILNASCNRYTYITRLVQIDKKWVPTKFPIFCPKIVCNISGINSTSLSRFIPFKLSKTLDKDKGRRKPEIEKNLKIIYTIRDSVSLLMLGNQPNIDKSNWVQIKEIYDGINIEEELKNIGLKVTMDSRDEDNIKPVCAIAKWIHQDVLKKVLNYIPEYIKSQEQLETEDVTHTLLEIMYEKISEDVWVTPKTISLWLDGFEEFKYLKSIPHWVGKRLTQYSFMFRRTNKKREYLLTKKKIQEVTLKYFKKPMGDISDVSDVYPEGVLTIKKGVIEKEKKHLNENLQHLIDHSVNVTNVTNVTNTYENNSSFESLGVPQETQVPKPQIKTFETPETIKTPEPSFLVGMMADLSSKAYHYIQSNPDCSLFPLAKAIGITDELAEKVIQKMKAKGRIFEPKPDQLRVFE